MALDKISFKKVRHYKRIVRGAYIQNLDIVRVVKDYCWYLYVNGKRVPDYSIKKYLEEPSEAFPYECEDEYMLLKKGGFLKMVRRQMLLRSMDGTFKLINKEYRLRFSIYPTLEKAKRALLDHLYP